MTFTCGAAKRDFSPTPEMLPFSGGYNTQYTYVENPLHVRAICLSDGTTPALILTFEMGSVPDPDILLDKVAAETGIPKENIFAAGTHAHAAPHSPRRPFPRRQHAPQTDEEEVKRLGVYFERIYDLTVEAVKEAQANMKPAVMKYQFGESFINTNRNQDYHLHDNYEAVLNEATQNFPLKVREENGETVVTMLGINPKGPSDKTLAVIKFEDEEGKPIAWFMNHSTHSVVMHTNLLHAISSDFSGLTSKFMEDKFPGSVACWTAGSSGDQNPVIMSNNYAPDPTTGYMPMGANNADPLDLMRRVSYQHFDDVLKTIKVMKTAVDPTIRCAKEICQPTPKDPENPCNIGMSLFQIGPVNLVGVSGELFTTIGLALKKASQSDNTVIVSYHSALGENGVGYILDDDGLERGCWGWNRYPGRIGATVPAMTDCLRKMMKEAK